MTESTPLDVHVVAHTHWDREWYHPAGRFRQRLVALVDELIDDPPPEGESFLLDGQAIVIDDYLAVRPERRDALAALLRARRLEAGPWYVLPDELIPSGEALVRNLLAGRRALRALGAAPPPVLYCPDSFGHPAALPAIAHGFGAGVIVLWRGYGGARWPSGDIARWRAPGGESALLYHLAPDGYELGSSLPVAERSVRERWTRLRSVLAPRATLHLALLPNGADHHARQRQQREAVDALAAIVAHDSVQRSSLSTFAAQVELRASKRKIPEVAGELRDSYGYTWTLQGTFGSRAAQKHRNAAVERLLLRDAEAWAALATRAGAADRSPLLRAAWRTLLECHPHDSLCGCAIDAVARAVDARLSDALAQGRGIRDDALLDVIGHDPVSARERRAEWTPVVVVRNAAARARRGVAEVRVANFVRDVAVGPGSGRVARESARAARKDRQALGAPFTLRDRFHVAPVQTLHVSLATDLTESARHYPDADRVAVSKALVWVDEVAGYGTRSLPLSPGATEAGALPADVAPVTAGDGFLDNSLVRIEWDGDGRLTLHDRRTGRTIDSLLAVGDKTDRGDLYTPSIRGETRELRNANPQLIAAGPLRAAVSIEYRRPTVADALVTVSLDAGARFARVAVRGVNHSHDHRLRIFFATAIERGETWADAAFGPVRRVPLDVPPEDRVAETPQPAAPLHRYVSLFGGATGATIYSDGLAEYETRADGRIAVTLLRAVGELSRDDLPERPGHAGWPARTPAAQSIGPFSARFALLLHDARNDAVTAEIERCADDVLLPLRGATLRSALGVPTATRGVELFGDGLAFSACKPAEQPGWTVLRCVNLLESPVEGMWRFERPVTHAVRARLDETLGDALQPRADSVQFTAGPREVVTILVR
ncbi:MAG: glycoside hydrolase family 38 C-terminal domain-containing protein [Gemmatimonadaceae bacterium]